MSEDRGAVGAATLQGQTEAFIEKANQQKQLVGLFTVFRTNSPQLVVNVYPNACLERLVDVGDVYATLQGTMGSRYANDFNRFGRTWQVNVQADDRFRDGLEDVRRLKVRNKKGDMVPLGALLDVKEKSAPLVITRYNMYPAAAVNGNFAPGTSTGDGIALTEKLAEQTLPDRMSYEWTELTFLEKQARNTGAQVFALSVIAVFLILAALYESWAFPLAVILVVPVCVSCSLGAVWLTDPGSAVQTFAGLGLIPGLAEGSRPPAEWLPAADRALGGPWFFRAGYWIDETVVAAVNKRVLAAGIGKQDVNIFTQVGFVVLIGLACKNAILIVEFAKINRDKGEDLHTAVLDACKLRFRPIMMTSVAFMLGVLPLAVAKGAGAEMRQALGVAVFGGMLGVTAFGVILTPVFFALMDRFMQQVQAFRRLSWGSALVAVSELTFFTLSVPVMRLIAEFGIDALPWLIVVGFLTPLVLALFGLVVVAAADTARTSGGAVRASARAVRRVIGAARKLGAAVLKFRLRGGTK
jgi:multidrug efflux pump